jgi:hypothetical protein
MSQVRSCVNFELKANVSELSISIFRVDMMNDHTSLLHIPVCHIDVSSYGCTMQQEGRIKLCSYPADSNLSPCRLTWCPWYQLFCLLCSMFFHEFVFLGFSWSMHVGVPCICTFMLIPQIITGYQSHQIWNMSHMHTLVLNTELVTLKLHS